MNDDPMAILRRLRDAVVANGIARTTDHIDEDRAGEALVELFSALRAADEILPPRTILK